MSASHDYGGWYERDLLQRLKDIHPGIYDQIVPLIQQRDEELSRTQAALAALQKREQDFGVNGYLELRRQVEALTAERDTLQLANGSRQAAIQALSSELGKVMAERDEWHRLHDIAAKQRDTERGFWERYDAAKLIAERDRLRDAITEAIATNELPTHIEQGLHGLLVDIAVTLAAPAAGKE